jgi:hypothetical protein
VANAYLGSPQPIAKTTSATAATNRKKAIENAVELALLTSIHLKQLAKTNQGKSSVPWGVLGGHAHS